MIRLSLARGNRWLVLPLGVKVEVRPLTTAINQAALADARKRVAMLSVDADKSAAEGQPLDPLGANGANAAWLDGMWTQYYAEALGRYGIARWEGLADDEGNVIEVAHPAIVAFAAHPVLGPAFSQAYADDLAAQAAEGNVSGASSNGNTEEAKPAAETAPARRSGRAAKDDASADAAESVLP